ncbi:hypothetical protein CEP54_009149 [Fusarium duplospermum]|uniref:Malate dehydrogenase n=1 Tax=Fusarium duplospermum TaxID=1325734 RepID=A0A428PS29_9HYPO|nr:hypothetical protein CEP54_009149 [Fusarium duplospermum]
MLANSFLILASAALALANPVRYRPGSSCTTSRPEPVLPQTGAEELQSPPQGATLKHIALGFGIQNYTCKGEGSDATAAGALAMLYDVTHLYPGQSRGSLSQEKWAALTATALSSHEIPLNLNTYGVGASSINPFPQNAPLELDGYRKIPFAGHHYFNANGVPTFDLTQDQQLLFGKKVAGVKAPTSASAGPDGTGAVDWLYLGDAGGSYGVTSVYRVFTAGGNAHGCKSTGTDSTSYTAMYWFYG